MHVRSPRPSMSMAPREHGLELAEGRGLPGAADGDEDLQELRRALLRRELEGDGPAGGLRREAELAPEGEVVDLHHDAVHLVVEVVAVLEPVRAEAGDVL